jgi:hypothetical protein
VSYDEVSSRATRRFNGVHDVQRHYNATCITDAKVLKVDAQQLSTNRKYNAETADMFIAYLLKRNRALQKHLIELLLCAGPQRLMCTNA